MKKIFKDVNWDKVIICGVSLGWTSSMLYLMLVLTATLTA